MNKKNFMTYKEYVKLTENLGLERKNATCFYMGYCVCIFWFDNVSIMEDTIMPNHDGFVKLIKNQETVIESTDKEQIRDFILKQIEDIKAIKVDNKLKTMEQDFE